MVKEVGVVGDIGVVAMATREVSQVDKVLVFIGINDFAIIINALSYYLFNIITRRHACR